MAGLIVLAALPSLLVLLLSLLTIMPKPISGYGGVFPLLHLIPVFVWSALHPRHMPVYVVAFSGLMIDSATGLPLGLSSLCYVLLLFTTRILRKRISKEGFAGVWFYFCILTGALQVIIWLSLCMLYTACPNMLPALIQLALTCLCYPLLHRLLHPAIEQMANWRYRLLHA